MEAGLNWPDEKEVKDILDDDTTDEGDGEIQTEKAEIGGDDDLLPQKTTTTPAPATPTTTSLTMDDCFFQHFVRSCRNVSEATSYLEIFNYSVRRPASFLHLPLLAGHFVANLAARSLLRTRHSTP